MNEFKIKEFIFSLSKTDFMEQYGEVVHTDAFSAIASRCIDENACEQLKPMFLRTNLPEDMYTSNELICVVVKIIAERYIDLK